MPSSGGQISTVCEDDFFHETSIFNGSWLYEADSGAVSAVWLSAKDFAKQIQMNHCWVLHFIIHIHYENCRGNYL